MKVALTIGGSDPTAGAGIQMDTKVFQALGVYGVSIITAITAQNTTEVKRIYPLSAEQIDIQFKTLLKDIKPYGAKTGIIYNKDAMECIIKNIKKYKISNLIIDPVIKSSTATMLIKKDAIKILIQDLIPLSKVVTANIPEAEILTGVKIESKDSIIEAARIIKDMGAEAVVIKGGHLSENSPDFLYDGKSLYVAEGKKFEGTYHGTGCAFSSAFLSFLCLGYEPKEALFAAKNFVKNAIRNALHLGKGMYLLKI